MDNALTLAELDGELAVELAPRHLLRISHSFNNDTITITNNVALAHSGGGDGNSGSAVAVVIVAGGDITVTL